MNKPYLFNKTIETKTTMETRQELKLAVIIDADNVPSANVKGMMEEIAKYGTPTFKRIYGDWTKPQLGKWKHVLLENAITPVQQYGYTTGKNSTDSAMIIDAMDILYTGNVDGFCIVSSDSDFTKLATRLRESGMKVFGFGEKKTPSPFIVACDKFVYMEILKGPEVIEETEVSTTKSKPGKKEEPVKQIDAKFVNVLTATVDDIADESGWAFLGDVGNLLMKKRPDFDSRNYGFDKLSHLIKSLNKKFEINERITERASIKLVYVRSIK